MINKDDPRVKRTRRLIQESFLELMRKKGFDAVTIQDIAEKATINRGTFYVHYTDKYALLDEITAIEIENMISEQITAADEFTEEICRQIVEVVYNYIIKFYRVCKYDIKSIGPQIDWKAKQILQKTIAVILQKSETDASKVNINSAMISSAIYSAAYSWYQGKECDNLERLKNEVVPFIINGLQKKN